jgi:hypothetical protein
MLIDNIRAVFAYWWVILVGVIMPFLDLLKFLHPKSKEFRFPHWARIGIAALAIVIAELLAYRNQERNLVIVIEEKRHLSIEKNALSEELRGVKDQLSTCKALVPADKSLKVRLLQAADNYEKLWRKPPKEPICTQKNTMTPEEQQRVIAPCVAWMNARDTEYQRFLAPQIIELIRVAKGKGADVSQDLEQCAPIGACGQNPLPLRLRALSNSLNAHDEVTH